MARKESWFELNVHELSDEKHRHCLGELTLKTILIRF